MNLRSYFGLLCLPVLALGHTSAQEQSVNPKINESFQHPDVNTFVERFEKEGREVYDKRLEIIDALKLKPGMVVADIGAGTGLFTRLLAPKVAPNGRVIAVDIAREFVDHCLGEARKAGINNVEGVVCAQDDARLPAGSVDLAYVCDTYHHFEFPQKTVASIFKALKPGGQLVVVDFERIEGVSSDWVMGHVRAGKEVFRAEIEQSRFVFQDELKLFKENYFIRFQKPASAN